MTDDLGRLQELRDDIHAGHGAWGADDLADACAEAAAVPGFGGDPGELRAIAEYCATVAQSVDWALGAAEPLHENGDTPVSTNESLRTLTDDMLRALRAFRTVSYQVRQHAERVRGERYDSANAVSLAEIATAASSMTPGAEGEVRTQHARAIAEIDSRVAVHVAMRDAAEDFATAMHEVESQARTGRLSDAGHTGEGQDAEPVPRA